MVVSAAPEQLTREKVSAKGMGPPSRTKCECITLCETMPNVPRTQNWASYFKKFSAGGPPSPDPLTFAAFSQSRPTLDGFATGLEKERQEDYPTSEINILYSRYRVVFFSFFAIVVIVGLVFFRAFVFALFVYYSYSIPTSHYY